MPVDTSVAMLSWLGASVFTWAIWFEPVNASFSMSDGLCKLQALHSGHSKCGDELFHTRVGVCGLQWEKLRLEAEAAALRECTFAPKAVANNRRHLAGYVPIQDRLGELQRRRR